MAGVTLDKLPFALALSGGELLWIYQAGPPPTPWIGRVCTPAQLAAYIDEVASEGVVGVGVCSTRQLFAAMAEDDVLLTAFEALPADVANSYNIAWWHSYRMTIDDPFITGFIQPTIGYTDPQMSALFELALTFPV